MRLAEGYRNETVADICRSLRRGYVGLFIGIVLPIAATYPHFTDIHLCEPNIKTNMDAKAYLATNQYQNPDVAHTHPNSTSHHPRSAEG